MLHVFNYHISKSEIQSECWIIMNQHLAVLDKQILTIYPGLFFCCWREGRREGGSRDIIIVAVSNSMHSNNN